MLGLSRSPADSPLRSEPLPSGGWDALERRWRNQLEDLAGEFRQGYAAVLPATADTCQRCHLQALCRVGEDPAAQ